MKLLDVFPEEKPGDTLEEFPDELLCDFPVDLLEDFRRTSKGITNEMYECIPSETRRGIHNRNLEKFPVEIPDSPKT